MSTNQTIDTISQLLTLSGSQYRIYDLGRRISKLSKNELNKIELNQIPYPFPLQGFAWIAIAFWQKKSTQPYLWFVKLPLDERGLLNQGARNHFIAIIIEALGADVTQIPDQNQEEKLKANPYHFTPAQYKLAYLNSLLKKELKQPPSQYYQDVQAYFKKRTYTQWQNIGVQGLSDFTIRLDEENNQQLLIDSLPQLPAQVLSPICSALENSELSLNTIQALLDCTPSTQNEITLNITRSLGASYSHPMVKTYFEKILSQASITKELAIIIAGRCWEALAPNKMMMLFLTLLAKLQDDELFVGLFKDLVAIPLLRPVVLTCIRDESRSQDLSLAIEAVFKSNNGGSH